MKIKPFKSYSIGKLGKLEYSIDKKNAKSFQSQTKYANHIHSTLIINEPLASKAYRGNLTALGAPTHSYPPNTCTVLTNYNY